MPAATTDPSVRAFTPETLPSVKVIGVTSSRWDTGGSVGGGGTGTARHLWSASGTWPTAAAISAESSSGVKMIIKTNESGAKRWSLATIDDVWAVAE